VSCWVHPERDRQDEKAGVAYTVAEDENVRCQCDWGAWCQRRMTEEDLLCDWCRGRDHSAAAQDLARAIMLDHGDPRTGPGHLPHAPSLPVSDNSGYRALR
jgi:hypothetical protein